MGKRRSNGEGCISKRKDGRWMVCVTTGINEKGKPKKIYRYCKTNAEAVDTLTKLNTEIKSGIKISEGSSLTVALWCQTWLDTYKKKLASSTRTSYQTNLRVHINAFIGGIPLNELTTEQIQWMLDEIYKKGNSLSLLIKIYNVLNGAISKAIQLRKISWNPCKGVEFPKKAKKKIRVLTSEEQDAFVEELKNWDSRALFMTYLLSGARLGELPALTWQDVNLNIDANNLGDMVINKKAIVLHDYNSINKKTSQITENFCKSLSSERTIKITPTLIKILKEQKEKQEKEAEVLGIKWSDSNLVFPTSKGTIPYGRNIQEKFGRIIKKIGISGITIHGLRHTYATRLFEKDVDIKVISQQLGHKSVKITYDTYVHLLDDSASTKYNKLLTIDNIIE
jgi:integrase